MKIMSTDLAGVFEIENRVFKDHRGLFVKTFHEKTINDAGLATVFKESFYSISEKGVLRGMHFQLPPYDHEKLVYVSDGEILDVAVDIRPKSSTFGKYFSTILSGENHRSLYIAKGFAHGFLTLSQTATVMYSTSTVHSPDYDSGISWNSFGFDWQETNPIMSDRDKNFLGLKSLMSIKT
jgi:dTDP-4-dehydrorhamnose 3,5-epimerase